MIVLALITAGLAGGCVVVAAQRMRAFVEHVRATYRANVLLHGEIARLTNELESAEATVELLEAALVRRAAKIDIT